MRDVNPSDSVNIIATSLRLGSDGIQNPFKISNYEIKKLSLKDTSLFNFPQDK